MNVTAIGLVSDTCHECAELRETLRKIFAGKGITLDFVEVNYDDDPTGSMESVSSLGLSSPPSFLIGEVVFTTYYSSSEFEKALANLERDDICHMVQELRRLAL